MHIGRYNPDFLNNVWKPEVKSRHLNMSGLNLFIQQNATQLYASIDKTKEYEPIENEPNLLLMEIANGTLEGTSSLSVEYNPTTGETSFDWNPKCYTNGQSTDTAYGVVIAKPLLESYGRNGNWQPALIMYGPTQFAGQPTRGGLGTGKGILTLPEGLDATNLSAFLFFFKVVTNGTNIRSPSLSTQVTT
jgi:hypothetical protein